MPENPTPIIQRARREFEVAVERKDKMGKREAAEKAYLAVVHAATETAKRAGVKVSKGRSRHPQIRTGLQKTDPSLAMEYEGLIKSLHGECFYDGECGTDFNIAKSIEAADTFIQKAAKAKPTMGST